MVNKIKRKLYRRGSEKNSQSSFLFLRSDQSKFSLTLNSLNFVSILNNSASIPPNSISVIGGEPIIPSHSNIIISTANVINPQAIIPNIKSNVSFFTYLPLTLFINRPTRTPRIIAINMLNPIFNFSRRFSISITSTIIIDPLMIVVYSLDGIIKNNENCYLKLSLMEFMV